MSSHQKMTRFLSHGTKLQVKKGVAQIRRTPVAKSPKGAGDRRSTEVSSLNSAPTTGVDGFQQRWWTGVHPRLSAGAGNLQLSPTTRLTASNIGDEQEFIHDRQQERTLSSPHQKVTPPTARCLRKEPRTPFGRCALLPPGGERISQVLADQF